MSQAGVVVRQTVSTLFRPKLRGWLDSGKGHLYPYRPRFRDRRFWAVQGMVVLIAGIHSAFEILKLMEYVPAHAHSLSFVPISLFFIPVVYAALNFGFAGSVATAMWCTVLAVPNLVVFHPGMERVGEIVQLGAVDAIAFFVGQRVEREIGARRSAEAAGAALKTSEMKYRGLFESSPAAILVLDSAGIVVEANPAAGALFGESTASLSSKGITDLVGPADAERLLKNSAGKKRRDPYFVLRPREGSEVYLEPAFTRISDPRGGPFTQVLLRDVTQERQRQAGLRAYATHVLRAQEEERKRIAQELHDETVQSLVLLCRRLDTMEGATVFSPPSAIDTLHEVRAIAEGAVQGLRDFARALRPPTLDDLGLVTSIRILVEDLSERAEMGGQLKLEGEERRLLPDTELGLYRIAQEALRNVERHAQAAHVSVAVAFSAHDVRLEVRDNGVGFSLPPAPGDFAANGQLGLMGMQERAEIVGGRLDIHSGPGKGTRVSVYIPLEERAIP